MQINYQNTDKENILALFNEAISSYQSTPLTLDDVNISLPEVQSADLLSNTIITFTNKDPDNLKLKRAVKMIYTRLSIPELYRRKLETLANPDTETLFSVDYTNFDTYTEEMFKEEIIEKLSLHRDFVEIEVISSQNTKTAMISPLSSTNNLLYIGEVEIEISKD